MSRTVHLPLERSETRSIRARTPAERRALLEEQIAVALFDGDGETVSRLRGELARLEALEADG